MFILGPNDSEVIVDGNIESVIRLLSIPKLVTVDGSIGRISLLLTLRTIDKRLQPEKILGENDIKLGDNVTDLKFLHFWKAPVPIDVKLLGKIIVVNKEQPSNAYWPILVHWDPDSNSTIVNVVKFANVPGGIELQLLLTTIFMQEVLIADIVTPESNG